MILRHRPVTHHLDVRRAVVPRRTAAVDWVDYFQGSEPRQRRQLTDPELWNAKLKPELDAAAKEIRRRGYTDIRIDGALRLSSGFAAGAALPRAAGLTVAFRSWVSTAEPADFPIAVVQHEVGHGDELALAICVTVDITNDVLAYIHNAGLPVGARDDRSLEGREPDGHFR